MFYQITEYFDPVGNKKISSKCPDCGNTNCLELNFYQKRIETPFATNITNKVSGILFCNHTNTEIAPVLWTDEIENYFTTEKQKLKLTPKKFKFSKGLIIILILITLLVVGGIAYSSFESKQYANTTEAIKNVKKGDKVKALATILGKNGTTWFLVKEIKADTIWLQQHKTLSTDKNADFDLDDKNFTNKTLKLSLKYFKLGVLYGFDPKNQEVSGGIFDIKQEQ